LSEYFEFYADAFDPIPAGDVMAPWCEICGLEHAGECEQGYNEED
jgi:hypothetical protein